MQALEAIKIAIADDHPLLLKGLENQLKNHSDFVIVGLCSNGVDLLEIVETQDPHIVLTDILMPLMDGVEASKEITRKYPSTRVIAFSMFAEEHIMLEMLKAGAKGYILKNSHQEEIVHAIRAVYNNGMYYCCDMLERMILLLENHVLNKAESSDSMQTFSEKEKSVIRMICEEFSSKEMAEKLNVSIRAIESIRERLQDKIGTKNMVGIAMYAVKHRLFTPL